MNNTTSVALKLLVIFILLNSVNTYALEAGCKIQPRDLNKVATRAVKKFAAKGESLPDSLVITSEFSAVISSDPVTTDQKFFGTLEGFYRPLDDDYYSILPIPILGMHLSRARNVIYLCAHYDKDPKMTHLTLYAMEGFHLDPTSLQTIIGDTFSGPKLKVQPLPATIVGLSTFRKFFAKILRWFPLGDFSFKTIDALQRFIASILGDITGVGVERVVLTSEYVQVASGIDLNNPDKAMITKTFHLNDTEETKPTFPPSHSRE